MWPVRWRLSTIWVQVQPKAYPVAVFRHRGDPETDASPAVTTVPEIDLEASYRQAVIDHLPHLLRSHAYAEEK